MTTDLGSCKWSWGKDADHNVVQVGLWNGHVGLLLVLSLDKFHEIVG
jgi:hypothetical protein